MVLRMCSKYYDAYGIVKYLDNETMSKFESIIQGMAASSLRCIAFAYAEVDVQELGDERENSGIVVKDNGLTLLGLVGIKDPCRPGVKTAVEACHHAGVNVKMITVIVSAHTVNMFLKGKHEYHGLNQTTLIGSKYSALNNKTA
ncbi:unnamed protein product [Vicia faba]|uniref:Uncharacterized protein n=1 Tax=Vicia faba TaxID=3906 RepID=A0AAV0Z153_VICFA|nr:unnamed protein product [Vicia faba]